MRIIVKLVGSDHERRSRLHTRRGSFSPRGLISALMRRRQRPAEPWMAPRAVRRLDELLTREYSLLELGSGASTSWYAQRCKSVVSIEPDPVWAHRVSSELHKSNANAHVVSSNVRDALRSAEAADVVIIDHNDEPEMSRVDAICWARDRAMIVVLDDSDRTEYRAVDGLMQGWIIERYVGYRPRPLVPTETTIFRRPGPS